MVKYTIYPYHPDNLYEYLIYDYLPSTRCYVQYMGHVRKVRLSCYLLLLSNDSKTRLQDSCTFMTWSIICTWFGVFCFDYIFSNEFINLPIFFSIASVALGQSYFPSAREVILKDMGIIGWYLTTTQHNKMGTVHLFFGCAVLYVPEIVVLIWWAYCIMNGMPRIQHGPDIKQYSSVYVTNISYSPLTYGGPLLFGMSTHVKYIYPQ